MTREERQKIYAALAAPFPENCIQRTDGRITGRGYSTTGIGYQFIANRLNEVLGVGGWRTDRTITVREVTSPKGRPMFEATCEVRLHLGEWQDGRFVPFADAVADGGHVSVVEADARKGAFTNGLKKAAALLGVGRQAYEGTLDDDNVPADEPIDLVPTARARDLLDNRPSPPQQRQEHMRAPMPSPPSLPSRARLTAKQLAALRAISRRLQWDEADLRTTAVERYGCQPEFITREQASDFIEHLSGGALSGNGGEHAARAPGQEG